MPMHWLPCTSVTASAMLAPIIYRLGRTFAGVFTTALPSSSSLGSTSRQPRKHNPSERKGNSRPCSPSSHRGRQDPGTASWSRSSWCIFCIGRDCKVIWKARRPCSIRKHYERDSDAVNHGKECPSTILSWGWGCSSWNFVPLLDPSHFFFRERYIFFCQVIAIWYVSLSDLDRTSYIVWDLQGLQFWDVLCSHWYVIYFVLSPQLHAQIVGTWMVIVRENSYLM